MTHFTEGQLLELETRYGLKPVAEVIPVRDGMVTKESLVWWRGSDGPEEAKAGDPAHWENIRRFPKAYQIGKPSYRVTYSDEEC
jgi:hypothetical protein